MNKKINIIYFFDSDTECVANSLSVFAKNNSDLFHYHIFSCSINDEYGNLFLANKNSNYSYYRIPYNFDIIDCINLFLDHNVNGYVNICQNLNPNLIEDNLKIFEKRVSLF